MKRRFPGYQKCMEMMRHKNDPQMQEDGFHWLRPHAGEFVPELIDEFKQEKDLGLRCWLLELIGSSKSAAALSFLAQELRDPDQGIREVAICELKKFDTKDSRAVLWQARSFEFASAEETDEFRRALATER